MADEFRKYAKEAFRQMDAGPSAHPGTERITAYVRGELAGVERAEVERHLASCAACRECAEELAVFLADAAGAAKLPRAELDAEYHALERRLNPRRVIGMRGVAPSALAQAGRPAPLPTRWMAIAAGVVLAVGVGAALYRLTAPSTPKLLAEAYRERRSSELRIAGAGYSELRQERAGGSAFSLPAPLLKAQAQIKDELQAHASDPALLRLEGEAQMVGGDAAGAVEALRRAHELSAHDAKTMADLGAAYAMLGDAEHDYGDYQKAIDFLEQSIRADGRDAEPQFNRAVTLEKLMLYPEAETAWEAYLKADPASGWAGEARKRLEAVREKLRQRQKQLGEVRNDPDYFLGLADSNGVDAEAWLIGVSTQWMARSATDSKARAAVVKLAALLARDHGDRWLQDMTAGACTSPESAAAQAGLLAADDRTTRAEYAPALQGQEDAARAFERAGCRAGAWRARLSNVATLLNSVRTEDCLSSARRLGGELVSQAYIRLRARVALNWAICATRLGKLEEADATLREALAMARDAHYGATTLDLANQELDSTKTFDMPSQTVARAEDSLRVFWSGAYGGSASRIPLSELRQSAGASGLMWAALDFARAKLWAVSGPDGIAIWKAPAYHDLGIAELEAGDAEAARLDFENSSRIEKIPTQYRIPPAAALARLDLARGDAGTALARLAPFAGLAPTLPWANRAIYYTALGEALERQGDPAGALAAFRSVADSASDYLSKLNSEDERGSVLKAVESAYRGMIAAQLATPGHEAAALDTWRAFRDFDAPRGVREADPARDATLWYVELPDGFAAWFTRAGETRFHRVEASKPAVTDAARRFLEGCGNPASSAAALRAEGRELYRWMIEPFAAELARSPGSLTFELDGSLASLPMNALMAGDGSYLGDRFTTLISSGRLRRNYTAPGPNAKVLIVANPAIAGRSAARFPPLPQSVREAEAIRGWFASSEVLEGRGATLHALAEALPRAGIVHFAGHGYSSSGYGGLLLAPADAAAADYRLLRASEMSTMDWSRCSLVALSACAAAEGETHGAHNPESLIRALTKAGAPRIAASLWNVDSAAAAALMSRFYLGLRNGAGVAESLRAARQAVRSDVRWRHPYYWAGFQLYGAT